MKKTDVAQWLLPVWVFYTPFKQRFIVHGTLSMSFQHFSTSFLSTTAGWWGWRGCWCGWKASFIKPMRPAPLRGFPAIKSLCDRGGGSAPGLKLTTGNIFFYYRHGGFPSSYEKKYDCYFCAWSVLNIGASLSCRGWISSSRTKSLCVQ